VQGLAYGAFYFAIPILTFYETIKLYSNKKSSNLFETRLPKEIGKNFPRFWAHPEKIDKNSLSGGLNIKKREWCVKGILAQDLGQQENCLWKQPRFSNLHPRFAKRLQSLGKI
jgi:hypothetical protein